MSKYVFLSISVVVVSLCFLLVLFVRQEKPNPKTISDATQRTATLSNETPVAAFIAPDGFQDDDPFFIYNNGSATDFTQGDQMFGEASKVGVDSLVMTTCPGRVGDFVFVGEQNASREQFLIGEGRSLTDPQRTWIVYIDKAEIVNGDLRIRATASVGATIPYNGGKRNRVDGVVSEIWKLSSNGGQPSMLERKPSWHNGVLTHVESPINQLPSNFGPVHSVIGGSGEPYVENPFTQGP